MSLCNMVKKVMENGVVSVVIEYIFHGNVWCIARKFIPLDTQ